MEIPSFTSPTYAPPAMDLLMPPPIVLRDYQQELVDLALAEIATHRRVCLYAPTGGGKTEMGLALVRHFLEAGQRPMWIANRIDLIEQSSDCGMPNAS